MPPVTRKMNGNNDGNRKKADEESTESNASVSHGSIRGSDENPLDDFHPASSSVEQTPNAQLVALIFELVVWTSHSSNFNNRNYKKEIKRIR